MLAARCSSATLTTRSSRADFCYAAVSIATSSSDHRRPSTRSTSPNSSVASPIGSSASTVPFAAPLAIRAVRRSDCLRERPAVRFPQVQRSAACRQRSVLAVAGTCATVTRTGHFRRSLIGLTWLRTFAAGVRSSAFSRASLFAELAVLGACPVC